MRRERANQAILIVCCSGLHDVGRERAFFTDCYVRAWIGKLSIRVDSEISDVIGEI